VVRLAFARVAGARQRFERTPLYFKEIRLVDSNAFGVEEFDGMRLHATAHCRDMVDRGKFDLSTLLTHRFRLQDYRRAFLTMNKQARHGTVKAVFDFELA